MRCSARSASVQLRHWSKVVDKLYTPLCIMCGWRIAAAFAALRSASRFRCASAAHRALYSFAACSAAARASGVVLSILDAAAISAARCSTAARRLLAWALDKKRTAGAPVGTAAAASGGACQGGGSGGNLAPEAAHGGADAHADPDERAGGADGTLLRKGVLAR